MGLENEFMKFSDKIFIKPARQITSIFFFLRTCNVFSSKTESSCFVSVLITKVSIAFCSAYTRPSALTLFETTSFGLPG